MTTRNESFGTILTRAVQAVALLAIGGGCAGSQPPAVPLPDVPAASHAGDAHAGPAHWSYAGEDGPAHWGDLSPDYSLCRTGSMQTPIDFPASAAADASTHLTFSYHPFPMSLLNNGHTVQVVAASGSSVVVGPAPADRYELAQFHFHSPSEHTVAGKAFDLELHLVHKNAAGNLLVVGLLFQKGKENPLLAPILARAPTEAGKDPVPQGQEVVDPTPLLPVSSPYFHYTGSLTTPPCTEGVSWYVMATPGEVSDAQVARFQALFHGATNRPVQPLGQRRVVEVQP
jgi:carbonic anhydrase